MRSFRSKTDPDKACSWAVRLKPQLCLERSKASQLTSTMRCPHSPAGTLGWCFLLFPPTKKDTKALPQKQTSDLQHLCGLSALSSCDHSGAGLPLALGLLSTANLLSQFHATLPPSLPPSFLFITSCMLSAPSLPEKMPEAWECIKVFSELMLLFSL